MTINATNDDPTAVDDGAATDEDTAVVIDVLANDSDLDGDIDENRGVLIGGGRVSSNSPYPGRAFVSKLPMSTLRGISDVLRPAGSDDKEPVDGSLHQYLGKSVIDSCLRG